MRSILAEVKAPETKQAPGILTVVTDPEGVVLSVNDALLNLLGLHEDDVFGKSVVGLFPEKSFSIPPGGLLELFDDKIVFECCTVFYPSTKKQLSVSWTVTKLRTRSLMEPLLQWSGSYSEANKTNRPVASADLLYKSFFYDSPQPMWIYDNDTLRFLDVNQAAITQYGYSRQEFLRMTITDIRPKSEQKRFLGHLFSLGPVKVSDKTIWVHEKKDGTPLYVEVQSYNFIYKNIQARLVLVNDVTQKEKVREILQESEARFRNMADNAPVMIWVSNENDKTTYVNKYWTDFTGISATEALGDGWNKVIHPDDAHVGIDDYKRIFIEKKPASLVYRLKYRTGEYRWVLDKSIPRFLEDGTFLGYIGSLVDIHDNILAEEKIRFQAGLIENASDIIISTDEHFNVITWNKRAEEIYEIPETAALTKNIRDLVAHELLNDTLENSYNTLLEQGSWQGEAIHEKRNGDRVYLLCMVSAFKDSTDKTTGYISVNRNITEKIIAEEKIKTNELKFRSILQNLIDVVFVLNKETIIKYVTPSVTTVLGYNEQELNGGSVFELIHPEDLNRCKKLFHELQFNNGSTIIADVRLKNKHGSWNWVEIKGVNKSADSVIDGIIVSLHDISERKQSEQQLQSYSGHITNILNSITDGFIALDHNFKILWWNSIAQQLTGIRDVDVLGKNLWEALPDLKKEKKLTRYQNPVNARKGFSFEIYISKLKAYFDISAYPSQQGLFIYFKDITHRKKQEMLLSLEKDVLELNINPECSLKNMVDYFLEGMEKFNPGLICSVLLLEDDAKTVRHLSSPSLPDGFIKKINGLTIGPEAGSCGTAIFLRKAVITTDIKTDPLWKNYRRMAAKYNLAACWAFPVITSSNNVLGFFSGYYKEKQTPTEEQLELFKRAATLMGVIIENKQAGQKINLSNERYMLATKATNDAIWDFDIKNKQLYWGENFYSIFGFEPGGIASKPNFWESRVHPEDRLRASKVYSNAIKNKTRNVVFSEYRFQKADGSYVLIADRAFLICDGDGNPLRFVGAMQDITDRKEMEGQLLTQEINRQKTIAQAVVDAQEKERAEIGKELHDNVNQILSTAKLYLELAKTDTKQKEALIKRSADSIFTAINEIRHISKALVPPSVKDLGLIESINDLVESLRLTNALKVQFIHEGDFDKIINDKQKLMLFRIIQEQVSNVLKHAAASCISIDLKMNDKLINLSIVDNGKGFEPGKVKFKKGVGLSNIESRAHLFNGEVTINSSPGKGCKLIIQVPIHNI